MKNFNVTGVNWKTLFLRAPIKTQYLGEELPKKGGLENLQIYERAWQKRGGDFFDGGWCPSAHYELEEPSYRYSGL